MGFKTLADYNKGKNKNFFVLPNDGDSADVIFLYTSINDVLEADVHYIKSGDYSGYVHCLEKGCPACAKGIRTQPKLFIPLYNIAANEIQIWDRTPIMEPQLQSDVFNNFPNPSEYVFRITRHGEARDRDTRYEIQVVGRNTSLSRDAILQNFNFTYESAYELAVKASSAAEIQRMLSEPEGNSNTPYQFTPTPRQSVAESVVSDMNVPESVMPTIEIPEMMTPPEDIISTTVSEDSEGSASGDIPEPVF